MVELQERSRIKREVIAFYDGEAEPLDRESWYATYGSPYFRFSRASHYFDACRISEALRLSGADPNDRALEIGCSFGHQTAIIATHFPQLTAVDISPKSIAVARRRFERFGLGEVRFVTADAEDLRVFDDDSFDVIYSFSTLRYCPDIRRALAKIYRVSAPGGRVVVDFPNRYCPWYGPLKRLLGIEAAIPDFFYSRKEAEELLQEVGFRDVRSRYLFYTPCSLPDFLFPVFLLSDNIMVRLPLFRSLEGTIMAAGVKDRTD